MIDCTPKNLKAEWHLTYRCDLACVNCNRLCFLPPQTPDMTLADAEEFCWQADELDWHPRIVIIGGEPTLHPDFFGFLGIANQLSLGNVELYSNEYSEKAKRCVEKVRAKSLADVVPWTKKSDGGVVHDTCDIFLAPRDFGIPNREPCSTHSGPGICGISVDHDGYSCCCMGGMIDATFQLGVRTKQLADLFNSEFAARQTRALCDCCGQGLGIDAKKIVRSQVICGAIMSPAWQGAVDRIKDQ